MSAIHRLIKRFSPIIQACLSYCYHRPLLMGVLLSILSSWYLILDYDSINRSVLPLLWQLQTQETVSFSLFATFISSLSTLFHLSIISAGHWLMVFAHALITLLLLLIAKHLFFSKTSCWALILLLLSHPNYSDYRVYILIEPLFWCCWLFAIYMLLRFYRSHTVLVIVVWLFSFLLATQLSIVAWFWLLLFPFGVLLWKPLRRKSVLYAILAYAVIVIILIFLPIYQGQSPANWLMETVANHSNSLAEILGIDKNWLGEEDSLMTSIFIFSGASTLMLVRYLINLTIICTVLVFYAINKKQYFIIDTEHRRILIYIIVFDWFISVIFLVLNKDSESIIYFSTPLLLLLLSSLGLSYIFKKIATNRYTRLTTLMIIWCLVAYMASGLIIFGPRKGYIHRAGEYLQSLDDAPIYADNDLLLFYAGKNPTKKLSWQTVSLAVGRQFFYYAYSKHRKHQLPDSLKAYRAVKQFSNPRGDSILIYKFIKKAEGNNTINDIIQ